ncbi:MAG: IS21 family transposase [Spirochaetes bacterium]|nr:IS21 family transposase [Spirochaetota bacterium]
MSFKKEKIISNSALKSGMSEPTARKYLKLNKLPSEIKTPHDWRTRPDPIKDIWDETIKFLELNSGLEAKTLYEHFQKEYPGEYNDGQLRTFQRRVKEWKAIDGPSKEIFFPQRHYPGELCEADFTDMNELQISINREQFNHMLFHFVLTYSNWEFGTICYSESLESLSEGLQHSLWELGGVPGKIRTDNLSAAIYKDLSKKIFTDRYKALLDHYNLNGEHIQPGNPHENGDIEQRHYRTKKTIDQQLLLRGSREFHSIDEYREFLNQLFKQLNAGRKKRLEEEIKKLKSLPKTRLDAFKEFNLRVGPSSTIHVAHNTYSVDSRLVKEKIKVRLKADTIEIYYGNKKIEEFPRLRGESKHHIAYRHVIDSLIRKPGAFENYRYRDDLFPTVYFRMAYDYFKSIDKRTSSKQYLEILYLAAKEGETGVDNALRTLFNKEEAISFHKINELCKENTIISLTDVKVSDVELRSYDNLLENLEVLYG